MAVPLPVLLTQLRLSGRRKRFESVEGLLAAITCERRSADARPPDAVQQRVSVALEDVDGHPCYTLSPRTPASGVQLLYLHGGAHIAEMSPHHWDLVSELVVNTGCTAHVPIFPLAPEHDHRAAFRMVETVYRQRFSILSTRNIVLMGDSSGGGFALALAQRLVTLGLPQPRDIGLISPWLDLTLSDPSLKKLEARDPWLAIPGLAEAARMWAGDRPLHDPVVSPINGLLQSLGRIAVFIGGRDLLMADCRRLRKRADAEGVPLRWVEVPEMIHVWPLLPLRAARAARTLLADLVRPIPTRVDPSI
jgi:monoterpene epsilon-lactone hydrolase